MQVKLDKAEKRGRFVTRRYLSVTNLEEQTTRQVTHYHFKGWEDYQVPFGGASLEEFACVVDEAADFITDNANRTARDER